jgi:hypothetical protein
MPSPVLQAHLRLPDMTTRAYPSLTSMRVVALHLRALTQREELSTAEKIGGGSESCIVSRPFVAAVVESGAGKFAQGFMSTALHVNMARCPEERPHKLVIGPRTGAKAGCMHRLWGAAGGCVEETLCYTLAQASAWQGPEEECILGASSVTEEEGEGGS